jgi:predicted DNA-binding transcriptional regulator AlpA
MSTINTEQIAELLGYTRKYVTDVLTKRPDFPAPVQAPSPRKRRWSAPDVLAWARPDSRQSQQA